MKKRSKRQFVEPNTVGSWWRKEAYKKGYRAGLCGDNHCPHRYGIEEFDWWWAGFAAASPPLPPDPPRQETKLTIRQILLGQCVFIASIPNEARHIVDLLAQNIQTNGLVHHVIARFTTEGFYEILDGAFRVAACRQLDHIDIPAVVYTATDEQRNAFLRRNASNDRSQKFLAIKERLQAVHEA